MFRADEKAKEEAERKANLVSDTEFHILENRVHTMENSIGEIVTRVYNSFILKADI